MEERLNYEDLHHDISKVDGFRNRKIFELFFFLCMKFGMWKFFKMRNGTSNFALMTDFVWQLTGSVHTTRHFYFIDFQVMFIY